MAFRAESVHDRDSELALTANSTEERQALVLGDGPRIPPLDVREVTADLLKIITRMSLVNTALGSREREGLEDLLANRETAATAAAIANLSEIMRTLLRHPDLFAREIDIGIQLLTQGALPARDRELAILRIGWLCQAPYEWGEHVLVAKRVGVTSEEIECIVRGSTASGWSEHERAILRATEELFEDAMISNATWAILARRLDERQLIELPIVVGQYQTVAYYQNSLRLRLHSGNLGLEAR